MKQYNFYLLTLILSFSLGITSCDKGDGGSADKDIYENFENQNIPVKLCGTYYEVEKGGNYYQYITIDSDGKMEGLYISTGNPTQLQEIGKCYYKEEIIEPYYMNNTLQTWMPLAGAKQSIIEWTPEYMVLGGSFFARFLSKSKQAPSFIGKEKDKKLIGKWTKESYNTIYTLILNEDGTGEYSNYYSIVQWFTYNEWLYFRLKGETQYRLQRYSVHGEDLTLFDCSVANFPEEETYKKTSSPSPNPEPDPDNNSLVGMWKHTFRNDPVGVSFKIFHSDGTLEELEIDQKDSDNSIYDIDKAVYSYNASKKQITVNWGDEEIYDYKITKLTDTHLTLIDPDGYTDEYVKYNGTFDDITAEYGGILYYDTDEYEDYDILFESPLTDWGSSKYKIKNKMSQKGYTLLEEETNKLIYKAKYHEDLYAYKFDDSGLCEAVIDLDASKYTKDNILEHLDDIEEGCWLFGGEYEYGKIILFYSVDFNTTIEYSIDEGWHTLTYTR